MLTSIGAIAAAALLLWSFRPQPVPVDIVQAGVGPVTVSIREQARTRIKDQFEISAPVTGFAPRLEWDPGDPVSAGEVLLDLQPVPASVLDPRARESAEAQIARARAALAAAEASLESAKSRAELAERDLERMMSLYQKGTIAESRLDRARAERRQAAAELRSTESGVEVARQTLRHARAALVQGSSGPASREAFEIQSPISGQVLQVLHESAGVVEPGRPLLRIGDPASLEVIAEVLTDDAVRLSPGLPVEFERWGGEQPLFGEVRRIEPSAFTKISALGVEEQRTLVVIDITSPRREWTALGHGYRMDARFVLWRNPAILNVPNGALFRMEESPAVFIVEGGRARLRKVVTGRRGELYTQILSGLEAGQLVIAHPDKEITDGARVVPYQSLLQ
ncbi:MAG: HlyD family efflux transporter periplasmic adaptor subunit [Wenzhouxiangellaceae bacterium]|nr:HlyD family efflux transporter periplasmic adaptor subunit [Wenzhouxiangellaceae bacterium]